MASILEKRHEVVCTLRDDCRSEEKQKARAEASRLAIDKIHRSLQSLDCESANMLSTNVGNVPHS